MAARKKAAAKKKAAANKEPVEAETTPAPEVEPEVRLGKKAARLDADGNKDKALARQRADRVRFANPAS